MELRKINPVEVNKSVTSLPDGVFGYCYAHSLMYHVSASKNPDNDLSRLIITKRNIDNSEKRFFFEIRKYTHNDIRLVGYISDEAQLAYTQKKGFWENEILVFPFIYEQFKNFLEIQLCNQFLKIENRRVEYDEIEISVLEISKFVPHALKQNIKFNKVEKQIKNTKNDYKSIFKNIIFHPVYSILIVVLIVFIIYKLTGINLKDFSL